MVNFITVAIVITVVVEAVKRIFAFLGKPIPPQVQFLISIGSTLVPVLAGGQAASITEVVTKFGELFAAVQAIYNTGKRVVDLVAAIARLIRG